MPWSANKYYYRSQRINGKPRRIYLGTGLAAQLAAEEDQKAREAKDLQRLKLDQLRTEHSQLDVELAEVHRLGDLFGRAALYSSGHYQHAKGDWRRRGEPRRR